MRRQILLVLLAAGIAVAAASWRSGTVGTEEYGAAYRQKIEAFRASQRALLATIDGSDLGSEKSVAAIRSAIREARLEMKGLDFWMRYLEPVAYKKVNGPLPVEWETEVFEKFEKPYKRDGAGLTLAYLYLEEEGATRDSLRALVQASLDAADVYAADSITAQLSSYHHFYLCNRLHLLNLAAIYTTGFECPETEDIIPELRSMMAAAGRTYTAFNQSFPARPLSREYLALYDAATTFVQAQPDDYAAFDHFSFIKDFINPLYRLNQQLIREYGVVSKSMVDYSLNKTATSIFDKALYTGQNAKGVFLRVKDPEALAGIERVGKLLFYDPILSGNNRRACASCHKPTQYFTDTAVRTAFQFNHAELLPRNTPSLVGVLYNHLLMLDGKHISLRHQGLGVISNAVEMSGSGEDDALQKVLSCREYKSAFQKLLKHTPQEPGVTMEHIASAITLYYAKFSAGYAPFDEAMTGSKSLEPAARKGFNLFMSKAQCATCHFVPQFNGVKPPYIGSEFEVLGVPRDSAFTAISPDKGRWEVNPANETAHAFRTGSVRNAGRTAPYMHNGVFSSLSEVLDFYDAGGGAGRGLYVPNQTLSQDSLHLTAAEKTDLIAFIRSLDEAVPFEAPPVRLPLSKNKALNARRVGGVY